MNIFSKTTRVVRWFYRSCDINSVHVPLNTLHFDPLDQAWTKRPVSGDDGVQVVLSDVEETAGSMDVGELASQGGSGKVTELITLSY